jgi:hypothetical protein
MKKEKTNNKINYELINNKNPMLADILKISRYSLIRTFQDNGLRVFEIYNTMSKTRLAEKLIAELNKK